MHNIANHIRELAGSCGERQAIIIRNGKDSQGKPAFASMTYAELDKRSDYLAWGLCAAGMRPGMKAVFIARPSLELYALYIAAMKLGAVPVLKATMNADLHMAEDLKNTGKGNLFVVFGEPDIEIIREQDAKGRETGRIQVKIRGVDVFRPSTGEIAWDNEEGIACWFVDTDYNEESFFVRQAYFLGQNDPYKSLRTTLKAEIDRELWDSLHSSISRPFDRPANGRIAVKVINHLGDEVMKVFNV